MISAGPPLLARAFLALSIVLTISACDPPAPDPEHHTWIGRYLLYTWSEGLEPCAGTFAFLDGFLPFAANQLMLDLDALAPLHYDWLTVAEIDDIPGLVHGGATIGRRVIMPTPAAQHELVHLLEGARLAFYGPRFLTEGLAVAFEERPLVGPRYRIEDPRPYLASGYLEGLEFYEPAGAFVAYLLSNYGPEPLFELYAGLTLGVTQEDFAARFAEIYGRDLDAEVDRYLTLVECPEGATVIPQPYECAAPTIPWGSDGRWAYARTMECEDDDVTGHRRSMSTAVTVDIPADGDYEIDVAGDESIAVKLIPCGRCPWLAEDRRIEFNQRRALQAGRHAIGMYAPGFGARAVAIRPLDDDGL